MGRLVISHHKSYHPYRRDNIERVKRDEEEARIKEEQEEGRMAVADAEARIKLLRERAGVKPKPKRLTVEQELEAARESLKDQESSGLPTSKGHINLFEDLEQQSSIAAAVQTSRATKVNEAKEDEKGVRLAPSEKDLKPWYSSKQEPQLDKNRKSRDDFRKSAHDPLTLINDRLHSRTSSSITISPRTQSTARQNAASRPPRSHPTIEDDGDPYAPALPQAPKPAADPVSARLSRESAERARAQALLAKKARESATATPSTVYGGYGDMYNRSEVEAARAARRWGEHDRDEGRTWDRRTRDQRW